jgi:hypothetical protein
MRRHRRGARNRCRCLHALQDASEIELFGPDIDHRGIWRSRSDAAVRGCGELGAFALTIAVRPSSFTFAVTITKVLPSQTALRSDRSPVPPG